MSRSTSRSTCRSTVTLTASALAVTTFAGCAHGGLGGGGLGRGRDPQRWEVDVATATGERTMEAVYELATEPVGADRWTIATTRTRGAWTIDGEPASFDSASPTSADPWPLTLQHLVASVPAVVELVDGRPTRLADPDGWTEAAKSAVYGSTLPVEALASGAQLVDPEGLVADLARTFPGVPPADGGAWVRADDLAGIPVTRTETCTATGGSSWSCVGTATPDPEVGARLFEVETRTELSADRRGWLAIESRYTATLVTLAPGGRGVDDRPVSGIRRVERR